MKLLFSLIFLTGSSLSPTLVSQTVGGKWGKLFELDGVIQDSDFGFSVADAGDVDGDGIHDIIIGAPRGRPGGLTVAGLAYVYSGATLDRIYHIKGREAGWGLGSTVAGLDDIDGDGHGDFMVGAPSANPNGRTNAGLVIVYSGKTGAVLYQFDGASSDARLGFSLACAGDVDGDGRNDLVLGAPGSRSGNGAVHVISGATGQSIHRIRGSDLWGSLGASVGGGGDINGDGFADVLAGAPNADLSHGAAYVFSGSSGAELFRLSGSAVEASFGSSIADAGDVNADGFADFLIGAREANHGGISESGSVFLVSGASGATLHRIDGKLANERLGTAIAGGKDLDGDQVPDFAIEVGEAGTGTASAPVLVHSGRTGELLFETVRFSGQFRSLALVEDLNQDGLAEVLIGSPYLGSGRGSAQVTSLDTFLNLSSDQLSASGGTSVQFALKFPASEAGSPYAVLASEHGVGPISYAGLDIPLTDDRFFQALVSGRKPPVFKRGYGKLDSTGAANAELYFGAGLAASIGRSFFVAAVTYDRGTLGGRMSSIARRFSVVP
jgi:FG-GAP repeat